MKQRKRILAVVGTRPEAIKMAPVILSLRESEWADVSVLATAQHRQMLDQVLDVFSLTPDFDLNIMLPNQSLTGLTARILTGAERILSALPYDAVLVQGDTTTVMSVALAAFYQRIPVGHVEAGLRTGNIDNPFPEEMNRVVAGRLARWHFAPTQASRDSLLRENYPDESIYVTGNTVIDALHHAAAIDHKIGVDLPEGKRLILVTAHRRENFGNPIRNICEAVREIVSTHSDVHVLFPVHPNPNVANVVRDRLGNNPSITLAQPLDYLPFVSAMKCAHLILTDSGGVQEEAPALGKPVLVMRDETERPEAVHEGVVKLVGTERNRICATVNELLTDEDAYRRMAKGVSPYGDGHAAQRIKAILKKELAG
jgi:UDP-N-acetylglucosamine 2-epimerase (non-hydrolysing)